MTKEELLEANSSELHQLSCAPESSSHHKIDTEEAELYSTTVPEESNVDTNDDPKTTTKKKRWGKKEKKKEKAPEEPKVTYLQLYRFADTWDWTCVAVGTLCAIVNGVGNPLIALLMGAVITSIGSNFNDTEKSVAEVKHVVIQFTYIGAIICVTSYIQMCAFSMSAENQTKRIREKYLHAILRQDIAWHDTSKNNESLNSRLSADTQLIFEGLADKVGIVLSSLISFVTGFVIAFCYGWRMTLVLLGVVPVLAVSMAFMMKFNTETTTDGQDAYAVAGGIAEQAIGSIRTVHAFDGQKREMKKYTEVVNQAYKAGIRKSIGTGLGMGLFMGILFLSYALSFWYGSREVKEKRMESGDVLTVLFGVIIGAFSLGSVGPSITNFSKAQAAAYHIFRTIDRVPEIDSSSPDGLKPEKITGHIVVKDVDFAYPSRPDVPILNKMNIEVQPGQTVALVGHSGSGKSTIIGLIERFYNPSSGTITLDGNELKDLNVRHLRDTIGLVSQEPVLFNATIKQNIIYGARKDQLTPTDQEIEAACRLANAHEFISLLPERYNTMVGERGTLLSGGQKQRIAIARAMIKNPRILLLDEATSALDTESERIVQAALDKAAAGRSTIVVAHRLSTIMNADLIYVMDKGVVLESGTHSSLMKLGGVYSELVEKQQLKSGGVDVEAQPESEVSASTITIAPTSRVPLGTRTSTRLSGLLRRMSSHHSATGSEKNVEEVVLEIPEDEETAMAREKKEAARKLKLQKAPISRTIGYLRGDVSLCVLGIFFAIIQGATFPLMSQVMSRAITTLTKRDEIGYDYTGDANKFALLFVATAVVAFTGFCFGLMLLLITGEKLTRKMRLLSYQAILGQEIAFFDRPENSTGALASRLATDSQQMLDMVSQVILTGFSAFSTITCGFVFGFIASWRMTLIILASVPIIGFAQYLELAALTGFGEKTRKAYEKSGQVAGEAIANIRTVVSLAKEDAFEARYVGVCVEPHKYSINKAIYASAGFALAQGTAYWSYAIGFFAGYKLVGAGLIDWGQMFNSMFAIVFCAVSLGHITSELPKFAKGKQSAINVYELLDKNTSIDVDRDGIQLSTISGSLALEKVEFAYPTRPDQKLFDGIDIAIRPSATVALVGPSGCGKSTIIGLLERWYDTDGGRVAVETYNLKDLQLHNFRNHMALVGQEPVLFDISIKDNILYGLPDNIEGTMEQVEEAARLANIHNFVASLPQGYDTRVGDKGSQLSGGQKQRIAIARALIRKPKVLLLDEATSALDSESEKLVQEALDRARAGRTTIVIAHRLSTIQDADLILVVKDGRVVESGRHYELIALGGVYAELCKKQNL
ncbi:Multidrug resistance protein 1 [Mortierella hygrophila]|uniref:Multidrug resistance protein 1 n=1 Tax=Mortierella hygrophila TaxID=979708 RepID=A0A9P6F7V9_9FUNG|nr:Multidrug resistance protein 1 [Mortierella hygrophila]